MAATGNARPSAQPRQPGAEEHVALRQALADLSPDRREAFVLTQVIGLSYAEAAEICDCPVGTIRSRVARARDDLRADLSAAHHRSHSRQTR